MIISPHKNARTTPDIRAEIAASKDSVTVLAVRYGVGQRTICRWRAREVKPRTPQTNGMVERFNGRISDVLKPHRFRSGQDMRQTLERYVHLYNHQLPQSALHCKTPLQTMNDWHAQKTEFFHRKPPPNHTRCDNCAEWKIGFSYNRREFRVNLAKDGGVIDVF
jgi:hypothetical protein